MDVYKTILKRRTIRSFRQRRIPPKELRRMINAARLAPSAANMQPLEFLAVTAKSLCEQTFKQLKWAGYIAPDGDPMPGREPVAYILVLVNKHKVSHPIMKRDEQAIRYSFKVDHRDIGAACQNIILYAQSKGISSCWVGAINKPELRKLFSIPKYYDIDSVIALGYPKMISKLAKYRGSIKYWLDKKGVLHVPKRPLKEVFHMNKL